MSRVTFLQAVARLDERGIKHSGVKDRGFMDSIYFEDPLGLLIELASYRFEPPAGFTHADVLMEAHKIRVARGDYKIAEVHLADAIQALVERSRATLSDDRAPKKSILTTANKREEHNGKDSDEECEEAGGQGSSKAAAKAGRRKRPQSRRPRLRQARREGQGEAGEEAGAEAQHAEAQRQQHDRSGVCTRGRARRCRDRRLGPYALARISWRETRRI